MNTVLKCDIAQSTGRDITGQDDDRYSAMKFLPKLRGELDSGQTVGEIIVGEYKVGSNHPACHQVQRRVAVARRCRVMTFALEESLKQLTNLRIVIDDKDFADAVDRCDGPVIQNRPTMFLS